MKVYLVTKKLVAITEKQECVDNTVLETKVFVTEKSAHNYVRRQVESYKKLGLRIRGETTAITKIDCINYYYGYEVEAKELHI